MIYLRQNKEQPKTIDLVVGLSSALDGKWIEIAKATVPRIFLDAAGLVGETTDNIQTRLMDGEEVACEIREIPKHLCERGEG